MAEYPDANEPLLSKQEIAHDRGRICHKRGCVVCAPLRERRQERKAQRRADAQAARHDKGQACGRTSCEVEKCVEARKAAAAAPTAPSGRPDTATSDDPGRAARRQAERHRVNLPCGSQDCALDECVTGFANERKRRHKARRPCRARECDNPVCVAARSSS